VAVVSVTGLRLSVVVDDGEVCEAVLGGDAVVDDGE